MGAGPAGLTLAHELAAAGVEVLVLEAGPGSPPDGGQDVTSTRSTGLPYDPGATRSAGVGGSAQRWSVPTPLGGGFVRLRELEPDDVDGHDGTPAWPVSFEQLGPYYVRARALLDLPPGEPSQPVEPGGVERHEYSFSHRTVFTERLPAELRAGRRSRLLSDCPVTEVLQDRTTGAVTGLRCRPGRGPAVEVVAQVYVLAAGALENARLMLASRSLSPVGIGNGHDQVGRHFMEHPHVYCGVVLPVPGGPDPAATAQRWDVVVRDGRPVQQKYGLPTEVLRREGLLRAVYKVKAHSGRGAAGFGHDGTAPQPLVDAYTAVRAAVRSGDRGYLHAGHLRHLAQGTPALARYAWHRAATRLAGGASAAGPVQHGYRVHVMAEQEPSPSSRLRLTDGLDELGVPLAELDWRLSRRDQESMARGQRLAAEALGRAVDARVVSTMGPDGVPSPQGGAHHMGTTRMSLRPQDGVADRDGRVHGVPNLYLAGSSLFPTGGAANPTLTIVALALRLGEHLVRALGPVGLTATARPPTS